MEQEEEQNLRVVLGKILKDKGISNNELAKSVGMSPATISQWLKGVYLGDNGKLEKKIKNFVDREQAKTELFSFKPVYQPISIARKIQHIARRCHLDGKMGLIIGQSGIGKTWATKQYATQYSDVTYIHANISYKPKVLFRKLHLAVCGYEGRGFLNDLLNVVIEKLRGSGRFLIIDQANFLNINSLHLIRTLHDESGCGVLLAGTEELLTNITAGKEEYRQIHSRITLSINLGKWNERDIGMVMENVKGISIDAKVLGKESNWNGKTLENLLYCSTIWAESNKCKIDEDVIRNAKTAIIY